MTHQTADQLFELAMARHESGSLEEAESLYRQILEKNPDDADALQLLGVVSFQLGRHDQALDSLRRASRLQPTAADCHYHLAVVLNAVHQPQETIATLRTATELNPDFAEALQLLATTLHEQKQFDEAIPVYRRVIALHPDWTDALGNLGNALQSKSQWPEAAEIARRVVERRPGDAAAWFALGNALHMLRSISEAIPAYEKAIALRPDYVEVHTNLADALALAGRLDAAVAAAGRALELRPDYHLAWNNLGNIYLAQDRLPEAIEAFQKSVAGHADYADGFFNLGNALRIANRLEDAAAAYKEAFRANPDYFMAFNNLGIIQKEMRQLSDALWNFHQSIHLRPNEPSPHSNFIYALHYPHNIDAQTIFAEHIVWNARHARRLARDIRPHANDRSPERRLRIGYVSADFREHSVGFFLRSLFENHDQARVEIFCYSDVARPDAMTARFRAAALHWRETLSFSAEQLAEAIRADQIDILLDLSGHAGGSRLPAFARKPAPIQITYLGYPDTTGLQTMDYRITDAMADPVGETERFHTEQLLRLPRTFLCYSPDPAAPEISPSPAQKTGFITFGSFNALAKITPPMIALWSEILHQTPWSRLIIKSHSGLSERFPRQRLLDIFASCGISADRLQLQSQTPSLVSHLQLYHDVDVALDTFPYHGTATTCEAIWMGVPVVTLAGSRHISRVGVSLLTNLGLTQFIAQTPEQYVTIAAQSVQDLSALGKLRSTLRQTMRQSQLTDGNQFARDVESAYRRVWRNWCQTQS